LTPLKPLFWLPWLVGWNELWPEEICDAAPCDGAEKRDVEKDGRAAKDGRVANVDRAPKDGRAAKDEKAGRAKLIRGAAKPPPPRAKPPRAKAASVETRYELPSAASAVTARTEVRVILVVSLKV